MCGKDRLNYYKFCNEMQPLHIWCYCRLSKYNKNLFSIECSICLDGTNSNKKFCICIN